MLDEMALFQPRFLFTLATELADKEDTQVLVPS